MIQKFSQLSLLENNNLGQFRFGSKGHSQKTVEAPITFFKIALYIDKCETKTRSQETASSACRQIWNEHDTDYSAKSLEIYMCSKPSLVTAIRGNVFTTTIDWKYRRASIFEARTRLFWSCATYCGGLAIK